jgi:hypothetical protein
MMNGEYIGHHRMRVAGGLPEGSSGTCLCVIRDVCDCHYTRANVLVHSLVPTWTSPGSNTTSLQM